MILQSIRRLLAAQSSPKPEEQPPADPDAPSAGVAHVPFFRARGQLPSYLVSVGVHAVILVVMAMMRIAMQAGDDSFVIETVAAEEVRQQEEFVQELDTQEVAAQSLNLIAGSVSTNIGGSEAPLAKKTEIDPKDVLEDPTMKVNVSVQEMPGLETLGDDLGEAEVTGEVGAVVEGYGAALDRLTRELIRMMRSHKLLVVWLFDESGSMKDDQKEIRARIGRVYEELKLVEKDPSSVGSSKKQKLQQILLTAVTSFGSSYHVHTPRPTGDVAAVIEAIGKIPVDETGKENMCQSLIAATAQYRSMATGGRRKLVLIVVSDESGDDGDFVEDALQQAKSARAPVYILGRESVFGSLYAHVRWIQPLTGQVYYLPIRRGPETPFAEQLQHDGFRKRLDSHMSGFGPYEQVRLARDTGGIFFQLPGEQENLNDLDAREFQMLDLKEYLPDLSARRDYAARRDKSEFRKAIWEVIVLLNPYEKNNGWLNVPEREHFSVNPRQSAEKVTARIRQIVRILAAMATAQQRLESVRGLRAREPSRRWRANFDLIYAQLFAYRVRLFEYAIALGQFGKTMPQRIKNPKSNRWLIQQGSRNLILPDPQQEKTLKVTGKQLKEAQQQALKQFAQVKQEHPNTPWSRRAEWEEQRRFGATFREYYQPPPRPHRPTKPRPKPPPPPKL